MKIIVTGARDWTSADIIKKALKRHHATEVVEGECRGADVIAREVALTLGLIVHRHPAQWGVYGLGAGPKRNQEMLDKHPDAKLVLAFHEDLPNSRGTLDMVRRSRAWGRRVIWYGSDGRHRKIA